MDNTKIALFKGKKIRRIIYQNEWWFSVVDVVEALTDSAKPRDYWYAMKIRVKGEDGAELSTICRQLKLESSDGKKYETDCANTEGIFRIIQSIPSPKAEPFKRWLAKVGYERVQEIDYEKNKVNVDLDKLYPNIDIAETLSNLTGKWIKKVNDAEVEFEDGAKINTKDLDYKLIKSLIWWE